MMDHSLFMVSVNTSIIARVFIEVETQSLPSEHKDIVKSYTTSIC